MVGVVSIWMGHCLRAGKLSRYEAGYINSAWPSLSGQAQ